MTFINLPPSCNPARPASVPTSNLRCTLAALLAASVLQPPKAAISLLQRPSCAGVIEARHQKIVHCLQVVALRLLAGSFGVQGFAGQGAARLLAQPDKFGPAGGHGHILLPDAQGLPGVFQLRPRIVGLVAQGLLEVGQPVLGLLLAQALGFEPGGGPGGGPLALYFLRLFKIVVPQAVAVGTQDDFAVRPQGRAYRSSAARPERRHGPAPARPLARSQ